MLYYSLTFAKRSKLAQNQQQGYQMGTRKRFHLSCVRATLLLRWKALLKQGRPFKITLCRGSVQNWRRQIIPQHLFWVKLVRICGFIMWNKVDHEQPVKKNNVINCGWVLRIRNLISVSNLTVQCTPWHVKLISLSTESDPFWKHDARFLLKLKFWPDFPRFPMWPSLSRMRKKFLAQDQWNLPLQMRKLTTFSSFASGLE